MELSAAEGRVLGCLIAQQAADPESYSLSLDEVRFACNQSPEQDREAFDDRTVDTALLSLKSKGLARFVLAGRNVGPVRYRHRADERWRLSPAELAVLAILLLGGPQTVEEIQAARRGPPTGAEPESGNDGDIDVEAVLDALAGRTPDPFATRVSPPTWGGPTLWAEVLTGQPSPEELYQTYERRPPPAALRSAESAATESRPSPSERQATLAEIADRLTKIERRLAGIEAALATARPNPSGAGVEPDAPYRPGPTSTRPGPSSRPSSSTGQESSRMIR